MRLLCDVNMQQWCPKLFRELSFTSGSLTGLKEAELLVDAAYSMSFASVYGAITLRKNHASVIYSLGRIR